MNLKFLRYDPTPGEKHAGIATVRIEEGIRIILRFKVVPKDGGGFYYQPASHKIAANGKDNYYPAFSLDSSYEYDELREFVGMNVEQIMARQNPSVFNPPQQQQYQPEQGQYQQQAQPRPPVNQSQGWSNPPQQHQYRQDNPPMPDDQNLPF